MKTVTEMKYSIAPKTCWVEQLNKKCPFLVPPAGGRSNHCAFFGIYLQSFMKDRLTYVRRCDECMRWRASMNVTMMPE